MSRRSTSWRRRVRNGALVLAVVPAIGGGAFAAPVQDGTAAGEAFLQGRFDTRAGISSNAVKPIQGTALMSTPGGVTFSGAAVCASTNPAAPLLSVTGVALPTGDMIGVKLMADLDLDNTPETTVTIPDAVSGVCTNGVVFCDPGTWLNCTSSMWTATTTTLDLVPVNLTELIGCYCINDSCASTASQNEPDKVLAQVASGALSAIQQVNAQFVVTRKDATPTTVSYYGSDPTGCQPTGTNPKALFGAPDQVAGAVSNEIASQSGTPGSIYNLVFDAAQRADNTLTTNTCSITRSVTMSEYSPSNLLQSCAAGTVVYDQNHVVGDYTFRLQAACGPGAAELTFTATNGSCGTWSFSTADSSLIHPDHSRSIVPTAAGICGTDYLGVWLGGFGTSHGCGADGVCKYGIKAQQRRKNRSDRWASFEISFVPVPPASSCRIDTEFVDDQCATFAADRECTLKSEIVDGVQTILNGEPTGAAPAASTVTLTGNYCGLNVTRPWWQKDQTWLCNRPQKTWDFSDGLYRASVAQQTVTEGGAFSEVHRDANGNWVSQDITVGQPAELPPFGGCEQVCKVQASVADDRVAVRGVVGPNRANAPRDTFRYVQCGSDGVCPTTPGETVVAPCQCLNEFGEAATIMQLMRQAGQDLICSP